MELMNGLKIINNIDNSLEGLLTRCEINEGYYTVNAKMVDGTDSKNTIFIPYDIWRTPTNAEIKMIYCGETPDFYSNAIEIFRIPNALQEEFRSTKIQDSTDKNYVAKLIKSNKYCSVLNNLLKLITERLILEKPIEIHQAVFNPIGLSSVTSHADVPYYAGLHYDNCENLHIKERYIARNRLCVNIGKEPRYFVFQNLFHEDIIKYMDPNLSLSSSNSSKLIGDFLRNNQSYPLIKLKLNPYDAFIAPVERFMHEGYTKSMTNPDITVVFRGYFAVFKH